MAKMPSEWDEIFAFQMNMNKTQKTEFKASLSPLPIKGEKNLVPSRRITR